MTPKQIAKSGTEHAEQAALFCWASTKLRQYPMLQWMHAIPNGGLRDKRTAARLKAEGVKSGVADIFLPYPRTIQVQLTNADGSHRGMPYYESFGGLYIEMKRYDGKLSDITQKQVEFGSYCKRNGYEWKCAFGWIMGAVMIESYIMEEHIERIDA